MKQVDTDYLTMVSVTDKLLAQNETTCKNSSSAVRRITTIRTLHADVGVARQGTTIETTGITEDKQMAVQEAIDKAVTLSKIVRSYALEQSNMTLHNQFKISNNWLTRHTNEDLVQYLRDILQRMKDISAPLEEYEVTGTELTVFEVLITEADKRKSDTRLAITDRKCHNQTIPQKLTALRQAFARLDNLVASWKKINQVLCRTTLMPGK